jgi:hypothetical protein
MDVLEKELEEKYANKTWWTDHWDIGYF